MSGPAAWRGAGDRLLAAYFGCGALHLLALALGVFPVELATKALLVPLLAVWLHRRGGPRPVVVGLALSAAGDVVLEFDGVFVLGMVCFAAAHACYVTYFVRTGPPPRPWAAGGYLVLWAVLMAVLWPDLGGLKIPVAVYSLLLTATAVTATSQGARVALGGALFLLSDTLIAVGLADHEFWGRPELVMLTYVAAQFLIASGVKRPSPELHVSRENGRV